MVNFDYSEEYLISALRSNLGWIIKGFEINNNLGSSAYRTSWGKWANPYPETTGYIIPSLINASIFDNTDLLKKVCLKQLEYFQQLQNSDGSFAVSESDYKPNVFDSAQIVLGLMALYSVDENAETLSMVQKCYHWLSSEIGPDGSFRRYNLHNSFNPLYYTRISWILLKTEMTLGFENNEKTKLLFERQLEHWGVDFINKTAFYPDSIAFSHNVIYAMRGLYECASLLNHKKAMIKFNKELNRLVKIVIQNQGLPGQFYKTEYSTNYICSTGNLQLSLLLLKCNDRLEKTLLKELLVLLLNPVLKSQRKHFFNKGAIPASIPVYGKYQRFRYTNWTQKFFIDVLLQLLAYDHKG